MHSLPLILQSSTASSNAKTDVADPDTMIFEESVGECSTVMLAMGAVIGILAVLLGIVLTGWVWTCWKLKKVAKRNSPQVK